MGPLAEIRALLVNPESFFVERFDATPSPMHLWLHRVAPWGAVGPLALWIGSLLAGFGGVGFVVALGRLALHMSTWLGIALVLPTVARQFHTELDDRQAFVVTTYASIPLWAAGVFYAVPEEPRFLHVWSMMLLFLVAIFCVHLVRKAMAALGVAAAAQMPLVAGIAGAAFLVYGILFLVFGIVSHIVLYALG